MTPVPEHIKSELRKALIRADRDAIIALIETHSIDVNSSVSNEEVNPILLAATNTLSKYHGSQQQVDVIRFLLEQGANPDIKVTEGYNALHLALDYHTLSAIALMLIRSGRAGANETDAQGNNPLFVAVREYGKTWRPDQKEVNQLRFEIVEELLQRGGDLDMENKHGMSARKWAEKLPVHDRLHSLISRYPRENRNT